MLFYSLKLREEKSDFVILRKTADGEAVRAMGYDSCLGKSVTDRKKRVSFFFLNWGDLCMFLGRGKSKILNLQEQKITERTKPFMGLEVRVRLRAQA